MGNFLPEFYEGDYLKQAFPIGDFVAVGCD